MRRILVDAARERLREKRDGLSSHVNIDEKLDASPARAASLVALDDASTELAVYDARKARVVELDRR